MKFSIRAMLAFTLIIALAASAYTRWRGLDDLRREIWHYRRVNKSRNFDTEYVTALTAACEAALADTKFPSHAYRSAEENFRRQFPDQEFGRGK